MTDQDMLLARMFNVNDFREAYKMRVDRDSWLSEECALIWEAMVKAYDSGMPYELVTIYFMADRQEIKDKILDLATCDIQIRNATVNLKWQIEKTLPEFTCN